MNINEQITESAVSLSGGIAGAIATASGYNIINENTLIPIGIYVSGVIGVFMACFFLMKLIWKTATILAEITDRLANLERTQTALQVRLDRYIKKLDELKS